MNKWRKEKEEMKNEWKKNWRKRVEEIKQEGMIEKKKREKSYRYENENTKWKSIIKEQNQK